jgi:hypothetical protein
LNIETVFLDLLQCRRTTARQLGKSARFSCCVLQRWIRCTSRPGKTQGEF